MIKLVRTSSDNTHFIHLVRMLDAELAERDGKDHSFYAQYNKIDNIRHAAVCYFDEEPVACGALKPISSDSMEVKRMYTIPAKRNSGIGTLVLNELEKWAEELSFQKCILETGKRQPDAIQLYTRNGYVVIPNYGQYTGVENSVCFGKTLSKA